MKQEILLKLAEIDRYLVSCQIRDELSYLRAILCDVVNYVKSTEDKKELDYKDYEKDIKLMMHIAHGYKEPVKLSDDEKIDFLFALNYTWEKDEMSDKSYINLIKKVCEL